MKNINTAILSISIAISILIVSIASYHLIVAKAYNERTDADFKMMIMLMSSKPSGSLI